MIGLNRIVAATDLSPLAQRAVERGALLAQAQGASLDVVHVLNPDWLDQLQGLLGMKPRPSLVSWSEQIKSQLDALADELRSRWTVTAQTYVLCGSLLSSLSQHVQTLGADLIVLGVQGEDALRRLTLGSTASRMISMSRRPMLVVRQEAENAYRRVLVAVDFSPSALASIAHAHVLAPQAEIILCHVQDLPLEGKLRSAGVAEADIRRYRIKAREEALLQLVALRQQAGLSETQASLLLGRGHAPSTLIKQARLRQCDLLVVGKHGKSKVEDFLIGSVTQRVLADARCDVLVSV